MKLPWQRMLPPGRYVRSASLCLTSKSWVTLFWPLQPLLLLNSETDSRLYSNLHALSLFSPSFTCCSSPHGLLPFQVCSTSYFLPQSLTQTISVPRKTLGLTSCHLVCCWQFISLCSQFYVDLFIFIICTLLLFLLLTEILEGRSWALFCFFSFSHGAQSMPLRA